MTSKCLLVVLFFQSLTFSQTLTGKVINKLTKQPLETATVYFDNTTIGTATNAKGEFSIRYTDAIQSPLVISFLGFEKVIITDYRAKTHIKIELVEAKNTLDEVVISYDDGLTRRQKLRLFRKEFLGTSKYGRSCKIANEDDLVLNYNKKSKTITAYGKAPLIIINKSLQYQINYDLIDFEAVYNYVNVEEKSFGIYSVVYQGNVFYKDLNQELKPKITSKRNKVYKGSVMHFMRALFNKDLKNNDYVIFYKRFMVNEWDYFTLTNTDNYNFKKVTLKNKVSILFDKKLQSNITSDTPEFYVDTYGNYTPIEGIYFGGHMGNQRVGDTLPLDYGL